MTFIRSLPGATRMFMVASIVSQVGSTGSILATTTIAADAAPSVRQAATYTSAMFFLLFGCAALAAPYTAWVTQWRGVLQTFRLLQIASFVVWVVDALLIAVGVPGYPVLLVSSVFFGVLTGWSMPLNQVALGSYAPLSERARSIALMGAAQGLGAVIGGPLGGLIVDVAGPTWVLLLNAISFLPLAWLVRSVPPLQSPMAPAMEDKPLRSIWAGVRSKSAVRGAVLVGAASALLIGPLSQMVVPMARDLSHGLAVHAGLLLGALAAGNMLAPVLLPRLRHANKGVSSARSYVIAACAMVLVAVFAMVLDGNAELLMMSMIFIVFAAGSMTGRSYLIDFVQTEAAEEERTRNLSAYFLAVTIGVTVGSLIWGQLFAHLGAIRSMMLFGAGTLLMMIFYWWALVRSLAEGGGAMAEPHDPP